MAELSRFSVSLDNDLLERFDGKIHAQGYPTRSKAVADLVRDFLVQDEWATGQEVVAVIVMVYDHHSRNLLEKITGVQHDYHKWIISTQHIHLDHDNCLEIVITKGRPDKVKALAHRLKALKGVKFTKVAGASTGKAI